MLTCDKNTQVQNEKKKKKTCTLKKNSVTLNHAIYYSYFWIFVTMACSCNSRYKITIKPCASISWCFLHHFQE